MPRKRIVKQPTTAELLKVEGDFVIRAVVSAMAAQEKRLATEISACRQSLAAAIAGVATQGEPEHMQTGFTNLGMGIQKIRDDLERVGELAAEAIKERLEDIIVDAVTSTVAWQEHPKAAAMAADPPAPRRSLRLRAVSVLEAMRHWLVEGL